MRLPRDPDDPTRPAAFRPLDAAGHFVIVPDPEQNLICTRDAYDHWYGLASGELPAQSHLDVLFAGADRLRVRATGLSRGAPMGPEVLLDTRDRGVLEGLARATRLAPADAEAGYCGCLGGPVLELLAGERPLACLGVQHASAVRWDRWLVDAPVADPTAFRAWLDALGIHPELLRRLLENQYDQNGFTQVGYQRQDPAPLSAAEQRVRVLELERVAGADPARIADALRAEVRADPSLALGWAVLGLLQDRQGEAEAAVAALAEAIGHGLEDPFLFWRRGVLLHALGHVRDALASIERAMALRPGEAQLHNSRGVLRLALGQAREAIADFDAAIARTPDLLWAWVHRARAHAMLGARAEARADAERARALLEQGSRESEESQRSARRIVDHLLT